jgi:hypothetical protein
MMVMIFIVILLSSIIHSVYVNEHFSVYLLRVKKNKKKKKGMGAGVLSLTDPFINRRLHTQNVLNQQESFVYPYSFFFTSYPAKLSG